MVNSNMACSGKPASPEEGSILDERIIEGLRELDALEEIGRAFLEEVPARIAGLRDALDRRDLVALEDKAHALKGSSGAVGGRRVAEVSARLEQMARAGVLEGADELVARLERHFQELGVALEEAWSRPG
jgi:HPt (histidine-containing phosphotransfer) domain-containing protein